VVGLARNALLETPAQCARHTLAEEYERAGVKQRWIAKFAYAAQTLAPGVARGHVPGMRHPGQ
jgi:hypothetical protein